MELHSLASFGTGSLYGLILVVSGEATPPLCPVQGIPP